MRFPRRGGSPPPGPSGVWAEYADGTRCEDIPSLYRGRDEDGLAVFEVIAPRAEAPMNAGVAVLPGKTALVWPMLAPGSEIP